MAEVWVGSLRGLQRFGYECVWQARANLLPISGDCWHDSFEVWRSAWNNVVCAHETQMLQYLYSYATEGEMRRRHASIDYSRLPLVRGG